MWQAISREVLQSPALVSMNHEPDTDYEPPSGRTLLTVVHPEPRHLRTTHLRYSHQPVDNYVNYECIDIRIEELFALRQQDKAP